MVGIYLYPQTHSIYQRCTYQQRVISSLKCAQVTAYPLMDACARTLAYLGLDVYLCRVINYYQTQPSRS